MIEVFKGKVIKSIDEYYVTEGLSHELKVKKGSHKPSDYVYVLKYIIDYIEKERAEIKDNQTIGFNSWILKFVADKEGGYLELYEMDKSGNEFTSGAEFSIDLVNGQIQLCEKYSSPFSFPRVNQKVVISDDVLDGYPVEAVRYDSPEHMTGWWITTDLYDGNIKSLTQIDLSELVMKRPDLVRYLALQTGFRFFKTENADDVWFDAEIAQES